MRTSSHVHGLEGFRPAGVAVVRLGNCLARFSAQVVTLCVLLMVPAAIENPATSWLWQTRWMRALLRRRDIGWGQTEFCMWQSQPFRKSTGFLYTTSIDMSRVFARRCLGAKRGMCLKTGCPHKALSGTDEHGKFWTKIAEPYPSAMCHQLASSFDAAIANRRYQLIRLTLGDVAGL